MSVHRQWIAFVIALLVLFLASGCSKTDSGTESGGTAIPDPAAAGDERILGYAVVPSLDEAIQGAAELFGAATSVLGPMNPDTMKTFVGASLGDPALRNFEMDKPIAVLLVAGDTPEAPPSVIAFLPTTKADPYATTLGRQFGLQSQHRNGVLVAASSLEGLEAGSELRSVYKDVARAGRKHTARIHFDVARGMDRYEGLIQSQLGALMGMVTSQMQSSLPGAGPEGARSMAGLLKAEVLGFLAAASQVNALQIDLDLDGGGLALDSVVTAKSGSDLAAFFEASSASRVPSGSRVDPGGYVTGAYAMDAKTLATFARSIVEEISKDPDCAAFFTPEMRSAFTTFDDWWDGTGELAMHATESLVPVQDGVLGVTDAEKCLDAWKSADAILGSGGSMGSLLTSLGTSVDSEFVENVRTHGGVSIHRSKTAVEGAPFTTEQDIAVVGGAALFSGDPERLDGMIDRVKSGDASGSKLAPSARKKFGAGNQMYLELDFVKMLQAMRPELAGDAGSSTPMMMAAGFSGSRARLQWSMSFADIMELATEGLR